MLSNLINEYWLIIRNLIYGFLSPLPGSWSEGTGGDVILIPGLHERLPFLKTIGNYLNNLGYRIHYISDLKTNTLSVNQEYLILKNYITTHRFTRLNILTHSKGGLVAKYLINDSQIFPLLDKVITIACPHYGSWASVLFPSSWELIPPSRVIKNLLIDKKGLKKITNIYPQTDNHIIPNSSLYLPGAKNIQLPIFGHTRILESQELMKLLSQLL